ncbi:MAG: hypothetical protein P4L34_04745 [Paludibacter sp.]|nr:hypothetical protein [Paludibacter sp.]
MNTNDKKGRLKKHRIVFWLNLGLSILSLIVVLKSIERQALWEIGASSMAFLWFINITVIIFLQLYRLQKTD